MMNDLIYEIVAQAEGYPYDLQEEAFVFRGGLAQPLAGDDFAGRTPVLAIGSNGAPARLAAKFGKDAVVPVLPAQLRDHAVVFAAAITSYGSVPATLVPVVGATALVAVTFLDNEQLEIMHESESVGRNYEVLPLPNAVDIEDHTPTDAVLAYRSAFGPLKINGQPVRVAEVPTVGSGLGAAYQSGMLALLHHRFRRNDEAYAAFIGDLVASPERRLHIIGSLATGLTTGKRAAVA